MAKMLDGDVYIKAISKADALIKRARKELDTKGYRENLGYDLYDTLEAYCHRLSMGFRGGANVMEYFLDQCRLLRYND